ncbi:MAG: hypothetical protein HYX67_10575 [Candidatus Melainabacteria bacterium]|nr:hypothetical protein [Candidatus Melainabacteria bacterium]
MNHIRMAIAATVVALSLTQCRPAFAQPTQPIDYTSRAILRFNNGDRTAAFDDINHAIKFSSIDAKALRVRAHFKAQVGDNEGALKDYAESLRCGSKRAVTYTGRGILYLSMSKPQLAYVDFERALTLDPSRLLARFHRMCLTGNKAQALADYKKIITTEPHDAQDHLIIGNAYVQFEETEKAEKEFTEAILLEPSYAQAYYNRAIIKEAKGHRQDALSDYDKAIESNSNYAKAYFNRGLMKLSMDDPAGGMSDIKRSIELDPAMEKHSQDKPFAVMTS